MLRQITLPGIFVLTLTLTFSLTLVHADPPQPAGNDYGMIIYRSQDVVVWSCSSDYKVGKKWKLPSVRGSGVEVALAKNEYEASQLILTPQIDLSNVKLSCSDLQKSDAMLTSKNIDILQVGYVNVKKATDGAYSKGFWPDPLFRTEKPLTLKANENHPFWIRVHAPKGISAGIYTGSLRVSSDKLNITVPLRVEVFNFELPDEMACKSALGDRIRQVVWKYQHLKSGKDKKIVAEKYMQSFTTHRISPYNCNPAGPSWQLGISVPKDVDSKLFPSGGEYVNNESHTGTNSLLVSDHSSKKAICAESRKINLPATQNLQFSLWYRTLLPERMGSVWVKFYDKSGKEVKRWLTNFCGNGKWQKLNRRIAKIPSQADSFRIFLYPAVWNVRGDKVGDVWFDDVRVATHHKPLVRQQRGSFETSRDSFTQKEYDNLTSGIKVNLKNGDRWGRAIRKSVDTHHFNTFSLWIKGMGGLTNADIGLPEYHSKQGRTYTEDSIEYQIIFEKYIRQLVGILKKYDLLDKAYVYMYDEPIDSHIPFIKRNYGRLKKFAPNLKTLMPTSHISSQLKDVIDYWVIIHYAIDRKGIAGSNVTKWSYICCSPRAPYIGEFIDRPGLDLRLWLWQTFSRDLKGILIWETLYWKPALGNPYENTMSRSTSHGWDWGNGDGRLLYPPKECFEVKTPVLKGPVETVRWEMIRDGIEDYEYLTILKSQLKQLPADSKLKSKYQKLLHLPKEITSLKKYSHNPVYIETLRGKIAKAIVDTDYRTLHVEN